VLTTALAPNAPVAGGSFCARPARPLAPGWRCRPCGRTGITRQDSPGPARCHHLPVIHPCIFPNW